MIQIINSSTDPYFNMALEEYIIKSLPTEGNYFMLWQNQPAVIIGRNQNTLEEINSSYIDAQGIKVVRRMSGGGAVYHDDGNLNFTFVVDANQDFANFDKFTRPVITALQRIRIEAENNGRNDLTITGRKFSGNAQFKYGNRLLHHGTILFNTNIEEMVQSLNPSTQKITSKGIKSVRSRVTNISEHLSTNVTLDDFKQILTEAVLGQESTNDIHLLDCDDLSVITTLRNKKYTSYDWIFGNSPTFNIRKPGHFAWGNIDIRLEVKRGMISACKIFGDFFALQDIAELETSLIGTRYQEEDVRNRLKQIGISNFLPASNEDEITELLSR